MVIIIKDSFFRNFQRTVIFIKIFFEYEGRFAVLKFLPQQTDDNCQIKVGKKVLYNSLSRTVGIDKCFKKTNSVMKWNKLMEKGCENDIFSSSFHHLLQFDQISSTKTRLFLSSLRGEAFRSFTTQRKCGPTLKLDPFD